MHYCIQTFTEISTKSKFKKVTTFTTMLLEIIMFCVISMTDYIVLHNRITVGYKISQITAQYVSISV